METKRLPVVQVAALPVRGKVGAYEVLLITSRETGRWVVPKGWPMKNKKDHQAAAREAFEEAGVKGKIHRHPMGAYVYHKRIQSGFQSVRVMVFVLEVDESLKAWPEQGERLREWMRPDHAASLVQEDGLSKILLRLHVNGGAKSKKNHKN